MATSLVSASIHPLKRLNVQTLQEEYSQWQIHLVTQKKQCFCKNIKEIWQKWKKLEEADGVDFHYSVINLVHHKWPVHSSLFLLHNIYSKFFMQQSPKDYILWRFKLNPYLLNPYLSTDLYRKV